LKYKSMCRCYSSTSRVAFRLQPGEVCFTGLDAWQNPLMFNLKSVDGNDGMRKI